MTIDLSCGCQPGVIAASHATASVRRPQPIMEIAVIPAAMNETASVRTPCLSLELAAGARDIAAAQRLRYRVFVEEMGARATVHSPPIPRPCIPGSRIAISRPLNTGSSFDRRWWPSRIQSDRPGRRLRSLRAIFASALGSAASQHGIRTSTSPTFRSSCPLPAPRRARRVKRTTSARLRDAGVVV